MPDNQISRYFKTDMASTSSIFKLHTAYNQITIRQDGDLLNLYAGGGVRQSTINLKSPHKLELKNLSHLMGILLFLSEPANILILGTAGGSLIHFFRKHYPQCLITAVDIDAELLAAMHQKMALPLSDARLSYVIDDALHYLKNCDQVFDLIISDVFIGNQSPAWLLEADSMRQFSDRLSEQGGLACNLLINSEHQFDQYYRDLQRVFNRQTISLSVEGLDNTLTYALRNTPPQREMTGYMQRAVELSERHDLPYLEILSTIFTTNPGGQGIL
ncbi:MAG: hypothetical protein OEY09_02210 [Gammaproteobacteria bacterium]|nr:hypothetical protein [Gammaproteobacteria bacterium]